MAGTDNNEKPVMSGIAALIGTRSVVTLALLSLATGLPAQTPTESADLVTAGNKVPIEVFKGPRIKHIDVDFPSCVRRLDDSTPCGEDKDSSSGAWAYFAFMIDPHGKPFEIAVTRSSGSKAFDKSATGLLEHASFEPATLNGKPIESSYEVKIVKDTGAVARPEFVNAYRKLMADIDWGDKDGALEALQSLKPRNLYEDAYTGLATYAYAFRWGNEAQQIEGLTRGIAREERDHYLPRGKLAEALLACIKLEAKAHEYGEALADWKRLEKVDKAAAEQSKPLIEAIDELRSAGAPYEIAAQMPEGSWHLHLFKRHFRAVVSDGFISQVKLRCEKKFLYFTFDPALEYEVGGNGDCMVELDGAPGTHFKLVQF